MQNRLLLNIIIFKLKLLFVWIYKYPIKKKTKNQDINTIIRIRLKAQFLNAGLNLK